MKNTLFLFVVMILLFSCKKSEKQTTTTDVPTVDSTLVEKKAPKTGPVTYYVLAKSGLNLRATANPKSEKLMKLDYGTPVIAENAAESEEEPMMIEGYKGKMIKVKYGNLEGYIFEGFLAKLPAPDGWELSNYEKMLRRQGFTATLEKKEDDGSDESHPSETETFTFPAETMQEAFIIARRLGLADYRKELKFDMAYPSADVFGKLVNGMRGDIEKVRAEETSKDEKGRDVETYNLKREDIWFDVIIEITRDSDDNPVIISDNRRSEGGGMRYTLQQGENGYVLEKFGFAD